MSNNLPRVTQKIFAENTETNIGQFGSARNGSPFRTGDIKTIQALPAWGQGWDAAVTNERNYPALEEMTGVQKVITQQLAYYFQKGFPEWDADTTYYKNVSFCQVDGAVYQSLTDNNLGNNPATDKTNWVRWNPAEGVYANVDLSNLSEDGQAIIDSKLGNNLVSNCLLSVVGGSITTDSYTGVSYVNKDCSVSGNVASGFGAAAYILLNKVFTDAVNFTFEIPFKLNAVGGMQYIAQINNEANGFGVKDGVLFLTYDGAEEDGAIQLQPNIDYTIKLERISAQKAYVLSLKTTGDYTEHLRVVSPSGFYAEKSVFLGGGSENFLNGTINLAGVTIKEVSTNYWTVSSAANFQTVTVQGTFNALMPDGLNADKTLNNENATVIIDKELLYSPSNGTKTVLVKNDGEVMIRPDYTVSPAEPADQPQGGVWYNTDTNVLAEQAIIYPNIQLINPSGGASPAISNGVLNITLEGQYADLPGTVTLGNSWDISMVLTGEPAQDGGFILGDVVSNSGTVMPSGIAIQYNDGDITAYFRREDVQVVEKETIISTAYLVAKDSGSTTGYVAAAGEADAFVAENTPVYSDQTMETLIENAPADTWVYSGYSFDNIQTTTGYVKEEGTGQFVAPGIQVYTDANCTTPQATASGTDYQFTGDTAASLIGTLTTAYSNTITLSYNGTQYAFGSQTLTSSDPIKSNCNITLGGISSDTASVLTGINLTTSEFSFWEWNGSSIDTPSYQAFVGAKIGEITDNGDNITATNLDAPLVLAKAADVANRDLSNLTEEGEKHFVNKTQLPPGVLEVPQNIKYTLNNGTFTLKAGSIITVPYGTTDQSATYPVGATFLNNNFKVADTSFYSGKFFVMAEVQADISLSSANVSDIDTFLIVNLPGNSLAFYQQPRCKSGTTQPTDADLWYNTSTNRFLNIQDTATQINYSFPIVAIRRDSGTVDSVLRVFNGFGYFGKAVWINKGVTMLCPNGKNTDGTNNNLVKTSDGVFVLEVSSTVGVFLFMRGLSNNTIRFSGTHYISQSQPQPSSSTATWYNPALNRMFATSNKGVDWTEISYSPIGTLKIVDSSFISFDDATAFVAADDNAVVHNYGNEEINGAKTFNDTIYANKGINVESNVTNAMYLITPPGTYQSIFTRNDSVDFANIKNNDFGFRAICYDINDEWYGAVQSLAANNNLMAQLIARRKVSGQVKVADLAAIVDANGNCYGVSPTYTANYADSSTKIVTTAYMANHWTTSKATTSSTASKARPAVVIQNYVSGYNWYRVWSDGWIEQGGRVYVQVGAGTQTELNTVISFLKSFSNTNYSVSTIGEKYSSDDVPRTDDMTILIQAIATNSLTVYCYDGGSNWYHTYIRWYACGY